MSVSSSSSGGDVRDLLPGAVGPPPSAAPAARWRLRWREWLVVVVAFAAAWPLWNWRGGVNRPGAVVDAPITLITSDRENLSCALDHSIGRLRCRFRAPGRPWPEPPQRSELLAPYVTVEKQIFLVPGLFEEPALVARYAQESPANVPRDGLRRFVARCKLRLVERVDEVQARWSEGWDWGPQRGVWVARPIACEVE
jgi:hypothetical protein